MPEPTVATPAVLIDPDALAVGNVRICAHTGVDTTHVRSEAVYSAPRTLYYLQRTIGLWFLAVFVRSGVVRVPIAEPLLGRLRRVELVGLTGLTAGAALALFAVMLQSALFALLALAALGTAVGAGSWRRRNWVVLSRLAQGRVAMSNCDPRFVAELERRGIGAAV